MSRSIDLVADGPGHWGVSCRFGSSRPRQFDAPTAVRARYASCCGARIRHTPRTPCRQQTRPIPSPPFAEQQQPWPGLACRMEPPPDHGETSYVGSGRLAGRKALITGGDSGIGRAVAIAFAREGADVAINYLPQEEEDARAVVALIEQAGRKAVALPGDLRDAAFCRQLVADAVEGLGGLDILVNNAARQASFESIARHPRRALRRRPQDQRLRAVPRHQGRAAAPEARRGHHQHVVRAGLRSVGRPARLRGDQGGHPVDDALAGQAAGREGHPRERGRARARTGRRCSPAAASRRTSW